MLSECRNRQIKYGFCLCTKLDTTRQHYVICTNIYIYIYICTNIYNICMYVYHDEAIIWDSSWGGWFVDDLSTHTCLCCGLFFGRTRQKEEKSEI